MLASPPLTDEGRWGYRGSINYAPDGTAKKGLKILPPSFTSPLIRLKTISNAIPGKAIRPPEHWFLAGNLTILYGTWRDARTMQVSLNTDSIYPLEPVTIPFRLGFDAVDWLLSLEVQFYEWREPINTLESQIQALSNKLDTLDFSITLVDSTSSFDLSSPQSSLPYL